MSIQVFILTKLMSGNTYPYKLKKELSQPVALDQLSNITESKLYYHFESLQKQGLIEVVEVLKEENRPDKHVYTITELGQLQLPEKIYELFEKSKIFGELILPTISLQYVDVERVISILQEKVRKLEKKYAQLVAVQQHPTIHKEKLVGITLFEQYIEQKFTDEIHYMERFIETLRANHT